MGAGVPEREDVGAQRVVPPQGSPGAELARLAALSWPIVLSQIGLVTMGLVDVAVCGRVGGTVLAAVGAGRIWSFGILLFGFGAVRGTEPIFAQAYGAGERDQMASGLAQAAAFALALSVPLAMLHWLCGPALVWFGQPSEIIADADAYSRVRSVGVPAAMGFMLLSSWLQGQGRVRAPMVVVWVGNLVNLVLDVVLVEGVAGVVPAMGARGCAWASTGVEWLSVLALSFACAPEVRAALRVKRAEVFSKTAWGRMASLGLPVGAQTGLEVWAFNAVGLVVGTFGAVALSAHVVAMQIISFTFMVPLGLGGAASARVGNLIGAGHRWGTVAVVAVGLGAAWMAVSALVLLAAGSTISGWFSPDAAVIAVTVTLLPVAAVFQVADGVQAVAFGVLRGAGDTRVPALANVVAYWMVGLPVAYWLGVHQGGGARGVWTGLAVALVVVAALMVGRIGQVARRPVARV